MYENKIHSCWLLDQKIIHNLCIISCSISGSEYSLQKNQSRLIKKKCKKKDYDASTMTSMIENSLSIEYTAQNIFYN